MTVRSVAHNLFGFMTSWNRFVRVIPWMIGGFLIAWLVMNFSAGPGVIVTDQTEAEGPEFRDASTLDLVSTIHRNRVCPSETQRWVWRKTTYHGQPAEQWIPLTGTQLPALANDGLFILTLSASNVPDPESGGWLFRSVTSEQCGFLPTWLGNWFGARLFRSRDIPVNFVGLPHEP